MSMTTDGPGRKSREALKTDRELSTRITEYFNADKQSKENIFADSSELGNMHLDDLLKHCYPSFEVVKGEVHRWLSSLRLCYKVPRCGPAVHELFLKQINQAIAELQEPSAAVYRKYSENEKRTRKEYQMKIQYSPQDRNSDLFVTDFSNLEDKKIMASTCE